MPLCHVFRQTAVLRDFVREANVALAGAGEGVVCIGLRQDMSFDFSHPGLMNVLQNDLKAWRGATGTFAHHKRRFSYLRGRDGGLDLSYVAKPFNVVLLGDPHVDSAPFAEFLGVSNCSAYLVVLDGGVRYDGVDLHRGAVAMLNCEKGSFSPCLGIEGKTLVLFAACRSLGHGCNKKTIAAAQTSWQMSIAAVARVLPPPPQFSAVEPIATVALAGEPWGCSSTSGGDGAGALVAASADGVADAVPADAEPRVQRRRMSKKQKWVVEAAAQDPLSLICCAEVTYVHAHSYGDMYVILGMFTYVIIVLFGVKSVYERRCV